MQAVFEKNLITESIHRSTDVSFGSKRSKIGLLTKLFGCRHKDLSRPFTAGRTSYRACTECGARREFNTQSLETSGPFFFPPSVTSDRF